MNRFAYAALGGSLFALTAGAALGQTTVFDDTDVAETRNESLQEAIEEDFERDAVVFGNEARELGFNGSFALRASASSGNTDTVDAGIGANFNWYDGVNGVGVQLNYSYSEDGGTVTEESLVYDFEYNRDFRRDLFGFAKIQGSFDEFSSYETDTFVGFGVGYRVFDTPTTQWSVQAGPGYRFAELDDASFDDLDEGAFSVSSDYYQLIAEGVALTNDTDVIWSESDTVVFNDLGVNVALNSALALRTSLVTEYHSDPLPGREDTDNTYGVSLVYSFD